MRRHTFVAANFFMLKMLNLYRNDLSVTALPSEMTTAVEKTLLFFSPSRPASAFVKLT